MPSGGVPMLFPRPSIASGWRPGAMISRLSAPRTPVEHLDRIEADVLEAVPAHLVGRPLDGGVEFSEPLSRLPKVSPSSARRSQAKVEA